MPGFLAEVLSKPHNRGYLIQLKTARSWTLPPTAAVLCKEDVHTWNPDDHLLATALTVLEAETCSHCGTPAWLGYSADKWIEFQIEEAVCYGCMEMGRNQEERSKQKNKEHGKTYYPVPRGVLGRELPTRTQEYERRNG